MSKNDKEPKERKDRELKEHSHQWQWSHETDEAQVFVCTVRFCHMKKYINKQSGREIESDL